MVSGIQEKVAASFSDHLFYSLRYMLLAFFRPEHALVVAMVDIVATCCTLYCGSFPLQCPMLGARRFHAPLLAEKICCTEHVYV
jgi:hypothetical protein